MLFSGHLVQHFEFLGGEAYGYDLHRFSAATGTSASASFQFFDVITGFSFVCPLLDLFVCDHAQIV